ncbi:MAG: trypsin-like peptidase domain-containing protein [Planctomycetes bacterium]|nr:trypsin-like peptidase domain-containing protein [Planctomycetota bacterium]
MRHAAVLSICTLLAGCAVTDRDLRALAPIDEADAVLASIAVEQLGTEHSTYGSAIPLGGQRLLTARHCLPEPGPTPAILLTRGLGVPFELLAQGAEQTNAEDWALIELPPWTDGLPSPPIDLERRPNFGDTIYLLGFARRGGADPHKPPPRASVVRATISQAPDDCEDDGRTVFVRTADHDAYHGLSGGPAIRFDSESARFVVFGLYSGLAVKTDGSWHEGVHAICRPPSSILAR